MKSLTKKIISILTSLILTFVGVAPSGMGIMNLVYAEESSNTDGEEVLGAKTIYDFVSYESKLNLENAAELKLGTPAPGYIGYTDPSTGFFIDVEVLPDFDNSVVFARMKGIAAGGTYNQPSYANGGEWLDGKDGRDYLFSFEITTGATMYVMDREGGNWPARPNDFVAMHTYNGYTVYGKHFEAGERVGVPCYGWDESWDKDASRLFMNPSWFILTWDNDASAKNFQYTIGEDVYDVAGRGTLAGDGGEYSVLLPYDEEGYEIGTIIEPTDEHATVSCDTLGAVKVVYGESKTVNYTITSAAGDESTVYSVCFSIGDPNDANIEVNPQIKEYFNASDVISDIKIASELAGTTSKHSVDLNYCDESGNLISDTYMINKGQGFFKEENSFFGLTGEAFNKAEHILTSNQFAPGMVSADSFAAIDGRDSEQQADEFKAWLTDDENYMFEMTPNHNMTVFVAFTQAEAKKHSGFINDGWKFINESTTKISEFPVMDAYEDVSEKEWWMCDSAYDLQERPFIITEVEYSENEETSAKEYLYIWRKFVQAGETVKIPVGGSAFSTTDDIDAPKVLLRWEDYEVSDELSGVLLCGNRELHITSNEKPMSFEIVAYGGDKLGFESSVGATAVFSHDTVDELPMEAAIEITSSVGTKVTHSLKFKAKPYIKSVTPSPIRSTFISNTGNNKIKLSERRAGEMTEEKVKIQKFEEDDDGLLQPVDVDGVLQFENLVKTVGMPFYTDRKQHKFIHVGEAFRNMEYFCIPSNDATGRRDTVYSNENAAYIKENGVEKIWEHKNVNGEIEYLSCTQITAKYRDYVLGANEYFSFVPSDKGVVYVALKEESSNYRYIDGWKKMVVEVPLPEGHGTWKSVEADVRNPYYPYQLDKVQYDAHATEYMQFKVIYYKEFEGDESVSIPTCGIDGPDVMAVMIGWENFVSGEFGGKLKYNDGYLDIRENYEKYTVNIVNDDDIDLSYIPNDQRTNCVFSEEFIKISSLPCTVTMDITNGFGVKRTFEVEFVKENIEDKKLFNFYSASKYPVINSEESGIYNSDKGFISFANGVYMVEEDLQLGVSAYYSDRLTHKFTVENTSSIFEGATYIRRPKKSGDYGYAGVSGASDFYVNEKYNGANGIDGWIGFNISSPADVYVSVPGSGEWPNKPDDWDEVTDVELASGGKVYMKSFDKWDYVCIPSMGWNMSWDINRESWDLPVYVINWK